MIRAAWGLHVNHLKFFLVESRPNLSNTFKSDHFTSGLFFAVAGNEFDIKRPTISGGSVRFFHHLQRVFEYHDTKIIGAKQAGGDTKKALNNQGFLV